jgi:hypothetical protein
MARMLMMACGLLLVEPLSVAGCGRVASVRSSSALVQLLGLAGPCRGDAQVGVPESSALGAALARAMRSARDAVLTRRPPPCAVIRLAAALQLWAWCVLQDCPAAAAKSLQSPPATCALVDARVMRRVCRARQCIVDPAC